MHHPTRSSRFGFIVALALLAACGGPVAQDAPPLLPLAELQGLQALTGDPAGGARAASDLAVRASHLRQRAAAARR